MSNIPFLIGDIVRLKPEHRDPHHEGSIPLDYQPMRIKAINDQDPDRILVELAGPDNGVFLYCIDQLELVRSGEYTWGIDPESDMPYFKTPDGSHCWLSDKEVKVGSKKYNRLANAMDNVCELLNSGKGEGETDA